MRPRLLAGAALALAVLPILFRAQTPPGRASDQSLTAHEWGTFTSIAGHNGQAATWLPLTGSTDLPSFVEHLQTPSFKGGLRGTVRMETPVLYFYANHPTSISVHVSFSQGLITEWYPHANRVEPVGLESGARQVSYLNDWSRHQRQPDSSISWDAVALEPMGSAALPREGRENHYYAARQTSSTPLRIKTPAGEQVEKFLFYRGVSSFSVPVLANVGAGGKILSQTDGQAIPAMLLFERRGDKLGFRSVDTTTTEWSADPPELNATIDALKHSVEDMLIAQGLYQDEAQAMFETWRDSWFEEGSRLLYIVPRSFVDSVLPLSISPAPVQIVRVFVGRLELVTPATTRAVEQALAAHDQSSLHRYGRFLVPILENMIAGQKSSARKAEFTEYLNEVYSQYVTENIPY